MGVGEGRCEFDPHELVSTRGFYERLQPVEELTISPDGYLWARRHRLGDEPGPIDVFRSDGVYAGTLSPTTPFPLLFLDEDRFVALDTDELDVEYVVVYRVIRDPVR